MKQASLDKIHNKNNNNDNSRVDDSHGKLEQKRTYDKVRGKNEKTMRMKSNKNT